MSVLEGQSAPRPRPGRRPRPKRTYKAAPERREQILASALAAFAERGYHATSIADVCARAGIGRATLYQYFADKRDLLVALADRIASRVIAVYRDRPPIRFAPGVMPSEQQAFRFVEARFAEVLSVVFEDAKTARLVLRAARGADGVVDDILRRIDEAVLATMERELDAAKEAGVIRDLDSHFVARFCLGGFEKIILSYIDEDRPFDVPTIAREAALLEVSGIYPRR
jgi:AcrR family transcriptional regulator